MADYKLKVVIEGVDQLSGPFRGVQSLLGGIVSTAGGMLMAMGIGSLTQGLQNLGAAALQSYADFERLGLTLQSLVTNELMATTGTAAMVQVGEVLQGITAKERKELDALTDSLPRMNAQLAVNKEHLAEAIKKGKESSAELNLRKQNIADLAEKIAEGSARVKELTAADGLLVPIMKSVTTGQMSMTEAMAAASPRAQELLKWATNLAIFSPFTEDTVAKTLQTAMGYGMTSKMAQSMTQSLVDYASGTGKSNVQTEMLGLALGQVWAKGKLTGEEMRQLTNAGLGVGVMARALGITTKELTDKMKDGAIEAEELIPAFIALTNKEFPNAAKNMATSWAGLTSTLGDIGKIGLRSFFEGTFKAIQPYVKTFVDTFSDPKFMAGLNAIGTELGGKLAGGLKTVFDLLSAFAAGGLGAVLTQLLTGGVINAEQAGFIATAIMNLQSLGTTIRDVLGAALEWLSVNVLPLVMQGIAFLMQHTEAIKGAFLALGGVLAGGMVMGVLGAIIGVLGAILSPIGLLIAAVALFGAAWAEDWGGMRTKLTEFWERTAKPAFEQLAKWFQENLPKAMKALSDFWEGTLQPALKNMGEWLGENIPLAMAALSKFWEETLQPTLAAIGSFILDTLLPAFGRMWSFINDNVLPVWRSLADVIGASVGYQLKQVGIIWETILKPALEAMGKWLNETFAPFWRGLGTTLGDVLKPISDLMAGFGGLEGILKSIKDFLDGIAAAISKLPSLPGLPGGSELRVGTAGAGGAMSSLGSFSRGGDTFHITINDQASAGMFLAFVEERRQDRLNSFMGVS